MNLAKPAYLEAGLEKLLDRDLNDSGQTGDVVTPPPEIRTETRIVPVAAHVKTTEAIRPKTCVSSLSVSTPWECRAGCGMVMSLRAVGHVRGKSTLE